MLPKKSTKGKLKAYAYRTDRDFQQVVDQIKTDGIMGIAVSNIKVIGKYGNIGKFSTYIFELLNKFIKEFPEKFCVIYNLMEIPSYSLSNSVINKDFNIRIGDLVHVKGILTCYPSWVGLSKKDAGEYQADFDLFAEEIWNETLECGYCQYLTQKKFEQQIQTKVIEILSESPQTFWVLRKKIDPISKNLGKVIKRMESAQLIKKIDNFTYALTTTCFKNRNLV